MYKYTAFGPPKASAMDGPHPPRHTQRVALELAPL